MDVVTKDVLSLTQAAEALGLENDAVLDLVFRKELAFTQTPSGRIQIPRAAIDAHRANAATRHRTTA